VIVPQPYKHLLPEEVRVWEKFLAGWGPLFVRFDYDVHVGPGAAIPEDAPEWLVRQIEAVSRDRVDVVAHTTDQVWIVEIKPRGGKGAVGQLIQYERLYVEELRPAKPVIKVLVCERLAPGVQETCDALGIRVFLV
jgi:hypothetical protein